VFEGESSQPVKNNQGGVTATRTVETVPETLVTNNIGIQQGDPEKEEDKDIAIGMSTPTANLQLPHQRETCRCTPGG